jgi:protein kinase-like protein
VGTLQSADRFMHSPRARGARRSPDDGIATVCSRRVYPGAIVAERWQVIDPLGSGAVGAVYRAKHVVSGRMAALKIIAPGPSGYDPLALERFQREAAVCAEIGHPGIVSVLDAGLDPATRQLFIAMDLLDGSTLRERMGRGALPYIAAALEPLAAAHARAIVHRDLKPENVFIEHSGQVKLVDFGLARQVGGHGATASGRMAGTPYYMAPEQAMSARDVTPAADVWAVGVMLYEAVAGQRPFDGPTLHALILNVYQGHHTPLSLVAPDVPPALAAVVERCLDKHPTRRPRDAGELMLELAQAGIGNVPALAPTSVESKPLAPASRAPMYAALVGLLVIAALLTTALIVVFVPHARRDAPAADPGPTPPAMQTVRGNGFRIEVPRDWEPHVLSYPSIVVQYGERIDPRAGVTEKMYVSRSATTESTVSFADLSARAAVQNGAIVEHNIPSTLSGMAAREVEATYHQVTGSWRQIDRCVVVNGEVWVVGCSGAASRFDEIRPRCHAILDSMHIGD